MGGQVGEEGNSSSPDLELAVATLSDTSQTW